MALGMVMKFIRIYDEIGSWNSWGLKWNENIRHFNEWKTCCSLMKPFIEGCGIIHNGLCGKTLYLSKEVVTTSAPPITDHCLPPALSSHCLAQHSKKSITHHISSVSSCTSSVQQAAHALLLQNSIFNARQPGKKWWHHTMKDSHPHSVSHLSRQEHFHQDTSRSRRQFSVLQKVLLLAFLQCPWASFAFEHHHQCQKGHIYPKAWVQDRLPSHVINARKLQ